MTSDFIPLTTVANRLTAGGDGIKVSIAAVRRWTKRGVLAANGRRIFLRTTRVGGRVYTRPDWLDEFLSLCAGDHKQPPVRTAQGESPWRKYLSEKHGHRHEKAKAMPDVRQPSKDKGAVHGMLPVSQTDHAERQGDGTGADSGGDVSTTAREATK